MTDQHSTIIPFSFEMKSFRDPSLTFAEAFIQMRFYIIRCFDMIAVGKIELDTA